MTSHQAGGIRLPRLRGPQDILNLAPFAIALALIIATGALLSMLLPQDTSRWMRLAAWVAPASLAFTAWWWKVQRD